VRDLVKLTAVIAAEADEELVFWTLDSRRAAAARARRLTVRGVSVH
jgi:hypothetical protein